MLAWFYQGGGEALYAELTREVMKLNIVGMLAFPMPTQPLGFFKKEIKAPDDLKGVRYRTVGLAADLAREPFQRTLKRVFEAQQCLEAG